MNNGEILIVDDEPQIRRLLEINLEAAGYKVLTASNGQEGIRLAASHSPDLILLDLGLPDRPGQEILLELRRWFHKAILILSVQDRESDIIMALDRGASDYMTKPFRMGELMARIRSCIRRNTVDEGKTLFQFGDLLIDVPSRTVKKNQQLIKLTATEFNLLCLFAQHESRVLTHQYILKEIWGVGFQEETQYLRVFVGSLRKKIEEFPNKPQYILTENGIGYRFC